MILSDAGSLVGDASAICISRTSPSIVKNHLRIELAALIIAQRCVRHRRWWARSEHDKDDK